MDRTAIVAIAFGVVVVSAAVGIRLTSTPQPPPVRALEPSMPVKQAPAQAGPSSNYLDSRTGPALERTIKRTVDMAGYNCESIRSSRQASGRVYADCGADGSYILIEDGANIRVMKE